MNAPRNTQYRHLDVQKIAGSLGAEVRGVDLSHDVSDEVLAVEVANTSLNSDRNVKLALYARSLIPKVWIVNLAAEDVSPT